MIPKDKEVSLEHIYVFTLFAKYISGIDTEKKHQVKKTFIKNYVKVPMLTHRYLFLLFNYCFIVGYSSLII